MHLYSASWSRCLVIHIFHTAEIMESNMHRGLLKTQKSAKSKDPIHPNFGSLVGLLLFYPFISFYATSPDLGSSKLWLGAFPIHDQRSEVWTTQLWAPLAWEGTSGQYLHLMHCQDHKNSSNKKMEKTLTLVYELKVIQKTIETEVCTSWSNHVHTTSITNFFF